LDDVENPDCFLLSGSLIVEGSGRAIVCAVGKKSRAGLEEEVEFNSPDVETNLKVRLENLANQFTSLAVKSALVIFSILLIHLIITVSVADSDKFSVLDGLFKLLDNITLNIAVIIMAVPEGLPLAVNIALAFIVRTMRKSNVLIRNIESPEVA
jgi:magnesium-transporting ATPase (P-type)